MAKPLFVHRISTSVRLQTLQKKIKELSLDLREKVVDLHKTGMDYISKTLMVEVTTVGAKIQEHLEVWGSKPNLTWWGFCDRESNGPKITAGVS